MSELEWEIACDVYKGAESVYYTLLRYHKAGMLTNAGLAQAKKEFNAASDAHAAAWAAYSSDTLEQE